MRKWLCMYINHIYTYCMVSSSYICIAIITSVHLHPSRTSANPIQYTQPFAHRRHPKKDSQRLTVVVVLTTLSGIVHSVYSSVWFDLLPTNSSLRRWYSSNRFSIEPYLARTAFLYCVKSRLYFGTFRDKKRQASRSSTRPSNNRRPDSK